MEYLVFYGELILTFVKAAFCANQNIHRALLHAANRFVCRSGYGVKILLTVIYNNVEVKIAVGVRGTTISRNQEVQSADSSQSKDTGSIFSTANAHGCGKCAVLTSLGIAKSGK